MKAYLKCYYERKESDSGEDYDTFEKKNLPRFRREVEACCLLNNYYWGVWALAVLRDKDVCDDKVFNYEFAISRIRMYKMQTKLFQEQKPTEASPEI